MPGNTVAEPQKSMYGWEQEELPAFLLPLGRKRKIRKHDKVHTILHNTYFSFDVTQGILEEVY